MARWLQDCVQVLQEVCLRCPLWWTPGSPEQRSISYGGATCAGHEREHVRIDVRVLYLSSGRKCTARRASGRCSAQLRSPDPCPTALPQHSRPPL
jgi:hypothetical protein